MADDHDQHRACVAIWMRDAARDATATQLVALFERAIAAMWKRAHVTLGDVTLMAIVDRVLYTASTRFPALDTLKVNATGVHFDELRARIDSLDQEALAPAIQFAMVEFLTVLGHLTSEILTPALHSALSRVTLDDLAGAETDAATQLDTARNKQAKRS